MHVSVTALGTTASKLKAAATQIGDYLDGGTERPRDLEKAGTKGPAEPALTNDAGRGGYYADSAHRPGRWIGAGTTDAGPTVKRHQLERVLLGQDLQTGAQLVGAAGSSGRARHNYRCVTVARQGPPDELLTSHQAARLVDVDKSYLHRLAAQTASVRASIETAETEGTIPPQKPHSYLDATKVNGHWLIERGEVERFIADRKQPQVVMGYDSTFSTPKSISAYWGTASADERRLIEAAWDRAVDAGMAYVEDNAISVGRGRGDRRASGMVAAAFDHGTSRELEPQLHTHVVVANMAVGAEGRVKALDGRGLFGHATTAGHLAEAEFQHALNRQGFAFTPTRRGIAQLVGVPDDAMRSVSTRRAQIMAEVAEHGTSSPQARQIAAYATRPGKQTSVDYDELVGQWKRRLGEHGFGRAEIEQVRARPPTRLWTPQDGERLDRYLTSPQGVTEKVAIFDRRDVIQAVVDHTGDRLSAADVQAHADRWLASKAVIHLEAAFDLRREVIGDTGKVALTPSNQYFTTPQMVAIESRIDTAYRNGHDAQVGQVRPATVQRAINGWETATGHRLGDDQRAMVHAITTSGDRFGAVVGTAGSGKTAALEVAARAWESDGYELFGAAVNVTAAEVLQASTGIEARTVAGLLTRLDLADTPVLDGRSVVIVDEASTLGNRAHARLVRHVEAAGATMRTIGDPAQHGAVEAGGMWAHLAKQHPDRTPTLSENRRQSAQRMADVRLAGVEYRQGKIAAAMQRLETNQRVVTATTSAELLDSLATDWYLDWQQHTASPSEYMPSRMMVEHHDARRELNSRAQALLSADGTLTGPGTEIGESRFYVGDQVITRAQNRHLRAGGGGRNTYVKNGTKGTVVDIVGPRDRAGLKVAFEGRGVITVPHE